MLGNFFRITAGVLKIFTTYPPIGPYGQNVRRRGLLSMEALSHSYILKPRAVKTDLSSWLLAHESIFGQFSTPCNVKEGVSPADEPGDESSRKKQLYIIMYYVPLLVLEVSYRLNTGIISSEHQLHPLPGN